MYLSIQMDEKIKIPEVKNDNPDYPNWKDGIRWGLVLSFPVFAMSLGSHASEIPQPPWYLLLSRNILPALMFSLIIFLPVCLVTAYRPTRNNKNDKNQQSEAEDSVTDIGALPPDSKTSSRPNTNNRHLKYLIGFILACILLGIFTRKIEQMAIEKDLSPEGGQDTFFATFVITVPLFIIRFRRNGAITKIDKILQRK